MGIPYFLEENCNDFPPPSRLLTHDLAVIGSNLDPDSLLKAYRKGYFPWYNQGEPRCWFHLDPRFVLFPSNLHISKSMRPVMKKFNFVMDTAFPEVIHACRTVWRDGQSGGSWISDEIENAYTKMFELGYAHCTEAWQGNDLVGGLYGIRIGQVFFGESMFSKISNASKFAFISFVKEFEKSGGKLIDCQQETQHLASFGAELISRKEFVGYLEKYIPQNENIW